VNSEENSKKAERRFSSDRGEEEREGVAIRILSLFQKGVPEGGGIFSSIKRNSFFV